MQVLGDHGRHAEDDRQHALGQAGVQQRARHFQRRSRGLLGGLENAGAAGRQRRADLAGRIAEREIPGREARHRTHRLLAAPSCARPAHAAAARGRRRGGLPRHTTRRSRPPCRRPTPRLGKGLALFHGGDARDVLGALAQQVRGALEDAAALLRRHGAPGRIGIARGGQRPIQVRLAWPGAAGRAPRRWPD